MLMPAVLWLFELAALVMFIALVALLSPRIPAPWLPVAVKELGTVELTEYL